MKTVTTNLICVAAILAATSTVARSAQAQTDQTLYPLGGAGGSHFTARCPAGQLLNGFDLTYGNDVDAIRPLCVIAFTSSRVGSVQAYPVSFGGSRVPGSLEEQLLGALAQTRLVCPQESPIVIGMYVFAEGASTVIVNSIHLYCGFAAPSQMRKEYPTVTFNGRTGVPVRGGRQDCPAGLVAVGITGSSGKWLDAVGLICGAPKIEGLLVSQSIMNALKAGAAPAGVKPQGRVKIGGGVLRPPLAICDAARQARARNSPAAPGLERQCAAEKAVVSTVASDAAPVAVQAEHTINVRVSYPKEFGYKHAANLFGGVLGPTSCSAFSIAAVMADGSVRSNPIPTSGDSRMVESGAYYVCNYLIAHVPLDQAITVSVAMFGSDLFEPWIGGGAARPPAGQQRTILDATRTTMLNAAQPRSRLGYEMVYAERQR